MPAIRDRGRMRAHLVSLLKARTGKGLAEWNRWVRGSRCGDERSLRRWLRARGVTGYPQNLLVMERFGYPEFFEKDAAGLIDGQYSDRPGLRSILDAVVKRTSAWAGVAVQARQTYVCLVTERRTFARLQPTTRTRVDLALRIDGARPHGPWSKAKVHRSMQLQGGLASPEDLDAATVGLLRTAYEQSR